MDLILDIRRKECYILLAMKNTIEIRVYGYDFKHDFSSIFRTLREVGVEIDENEIERSKADFDDYLLYENGTEHRYSGTAFMVYLNLID